MSYREAMESNKKREKFRNLFAPLRRGKSPSPGPKVNGKPNIQANQRTDVWAEDFLLSLGAYQKLRIFTCLLITQTEVVSGGSRVSLFCEH